MNNSKKRKLKLKIWINILFWLSFALILGCEKFNYEKGKNMQALPNTDIVFQCSTINALLEGLYDGNLTFDELGKYGNLGLGTFNTLDGEMIAVDGEFYKIKADSGQAYPVQKDEKTPFAVIANFHSDTSFVIEEPMTFRQLETYLTERLPSKNFFYAFRIEGKFSYIRTRSVPSQRKPYPRLIEVVKNQPVFEFMNVEGLLVGFYFPNYMKDINVPGYHFHFITKDRKRGGHLLECRTSHVKVEIDYISTFQMILPEVNEFKTLDLSSKNSELEKVER